MPLRPLRYACSATVALLAALISPLLVAPLLAQETLTEYRPEIAVTLPRWRGIALLLMEEQHLDMRDVAHNENQHGVGLVSPPFRYGSASLELREVRQINGVMEHRWLPALNGVVELGRGVELRDRARLELRDVAGSWSHRYEDRVIVARPIAGPTGSYLPYAYYELTYDTRFGVLNRREAGVGVRVPVGRGVSVDPYLMRQTDTRRDVDALVALGMILRVAM